MKKIVIILLFIIVCNYPAKSQGAQSYSQIIQIDSLDATALYQASKKWFILSFPSPRKVIQDDDPSMKIISGRGTIEYNIDAISPYGGYLEYTVQIQARDGRIKIEVTNITHTNLPGKAASCSLGLILNTDKQFTEGLNSSFHNRQTEKMKAKMKIFSIGLFKDIEEFIRNYKSKGVQDW